MLIANGTVIAVCDGEKLSLYRNQGDESAPELVPLAVEAVETQNKSSGMRHRSTAANPDARQLEEDSFAAGVAGILSDMFLANEFERLVVIAAPRTLGELRKRYHSQMLPAIQAEIAKDLTGATVPTLLATLEAERG
ncbi:host attachment family protein [Mesorhizobium retamae]|uniref:Host attachment protein n=1 Tax=Mesorhizobium retamae TaxID=2912854 RepID=A0ABS9QLC0_9HYPH|nr:host attachment protein [Mesorhizobium sp. IRAMC:0171]MCG7508240.1 host attachment protein [Mesorhizobium sp. IRAMC:0171]